MVGRMGVESVNLLLLLAVVVAGVSVATVLGSSYNCRVLAAWLAKWAKYLDLRREGRKRDWEIAVGEGRRVEITLGIRANYVHISELAEMIGAEDVNWVLEKEVPNATGKVLDQTKAANTGQPDSDPEQPVSGLSEPGAGGGHLRA